MKKKKRGKIVSIPCFLMVAVPSFVLTLYDNEMIQLKDEEPWYAAYTIIMILVIVISLFQCGLRESGLDRCGLCLVLLLVHLAQLDGFY